LAACGDDGGGSEETAAVPSTNLVALFAPQGVLEVGREQRLTLAVADAEGTPLRDAPRLLEFSVRADGEEEGTPVTAEAHAEGLPAPYYPVVFTPEAAGLYEITTTIDGEGLEPRVFEVGDDSPIPAVGERLPLTPTPTTSDPLGVDPLCTRDPACPFHEVSLDAALRQGGPIAFLIATPEFCQTALCGPVLDILVDAAAEVPGVRMVHSEVYANPRAVGDITQAELTPPMEALNLSFEPSLFVTDASGTITARLDNIYDRAELLDALGRVAS
jgi:hypothetical protein